MLKRLMVLYATLWMFTGFAHAETVDLYVTKAQIQAVNELATDGVITPDQAKKGIDGILARAASDLGRPVTLEELAAVQSPTPMAAELTWLQKAAGFVTFGNTMIAIASIAGVAALLFLFGKMIVELVVLFKEIPAVVYEGALVLSGVGLTAYATTLTEANAPTFGLIGALLYGGGFAWTVGRHRKDWKVSPSAASLVLALAWGVTAELFGSQLIGAFSVAALMSALGFSAFVVPGLIAVGFKDKDSVPRATLAAFVVIGLYVVLQGAGISVALLSAFRGGALYVGGFVAYLGSLIIASRWYSRDTSYAVRQLPMLVGGIGAIFLGSVLGIPELQKIGGTFFVLYLVEKPFEVPLGSATGYAAVALVVSAITVGAFLWANNHIDVVAPYLLFV